MFSSLQRCEVCEVSHAGDAQGEADPVRRVLMLHFSLAQDVLQCQVGQFRKTKMCRFHETGQRARSASVTKSRVVGYVTAWNIQEQSGRC